MIQDFECVGGPWCGRTIRIPIDWAVNGHLYAAGWYQVADGEDRLWWDAAETERRQGAKREDSQG